MCSSCFCPFPPHYCGYCIAFAESRLLDDDEGRIFREYLMREEGFSEKQAIEMWKHVCCPIFPKKGKINELQEALQKTDPASPG